MNTKLIPLALLLFVITGCTTKHGNVVQHQDIPVADSDDARYQKLYYDYRSLVVAAIKKNEEAKLPSITDEYATKTGKTIFLVTISQIDSAGKWNVLLHKVDPTTSRKLPKIHHASSDTVHIHNDKDFILCESNKANGTYNDNIHIRIAIQK